MTKSDGNREGGGGLKRLGGDSEPLILDGDPGSKVWNGDPGSKVWDFGMWSPLWNEVLRSLNVVLAIVFVLLVMCVWESSSLSSKITSLCEFKLFANFLLSLSDSNSRSILRVTPVLVLREQERERWGNVRGSKRVQVRERRTEREGGRVIEMERERERERSG